MFFVNRLTVTAAQFCSSLRVLKRAFGVCIAVAACLLASLWGMTSTDSENVVVMVALAVLVLAGTLVMLIILQILEQQQEKVDGFMIYIVTFVTALLGAAITISCDNMWFRGSLASVDFGKVMLWSSIVLSASVIALWLSDGVFTLKRATVYKNDSVTKDACLTAA